MLLLFEHEARSQTISVSMPDFQIHRQLLADCHRIGKFKLCHVLLHKNASVPWFILVPETEIGDLLDLPEELRSVAMKEAALVSRFIKQESRCRKINFASIGNVVRQMHLHVVGRREDDLCWPAPVWGNLTAAPEYSTERLQQIRDVLAQHYELAVTFLV